MANPKQNGLMDLLDAIRKYLLPKAAGGGYTPEEKAKAKADLEQAQKNAEGKTFSDYVADVLEMLGLKKDTDYSTYIVLGILAIVGIAIIKD